LRPAHYTVDNDAVDESLVMQHYNRHHQQQQQQLQQQ